MSEKRYDGTKILSQLSGIDQDEVKRLWEEVKLNHQRLHKCPGHMFKRIDGSSPGRYACVICSGEVDSSAYGWYMKGIEHAREKWNPDPTDGGSGISMDEG